MKSVLLLSFLLLSLSGFSQSYTLAHTADGRTIHLYDNGTWGYAPSQSTAPRNNSAGAIREVRKIANQLSFSFEYQKSQWIEKQLKRIQETRPCAGLASQFDAIKFAANTIEFSFSYQKTEWIEKYMEKAFKAAPGDVDLGYTLREMVSTAKSMSFSFAYQRKQWIEKKFDGLLQ